MDDLIRRLEGEGDPGLAVHLHQCPACRSRAEVIEALRPSGALEPVPGPLVDRVMAALPGSAVEAAAGAGAPFLPGHRALTFALASLTALIASVADGGGGEPGVMLAFAIAVGAAAAILEPRLLGLEESSR